mmetsp:Transcript_27812/g.69428  ORF Transcript_27812/g.69428 Transcript_27812/m.69428 type:complete len:224 (-) Transcript_27812:265-936(-)
MGMRAECEAYRCKPSASPTSFEDLPDITDSPPRCYDKETKLVYSCDGPNKLTYVAALEASSGHFSIQPSYGDFFHLTRAGYDARNEEPILEWLGTYSEVRDGEPHKCFIRDPFAKCPTRSVLRPPCAPSDCRFAGDKKGPFSFKSAPGCLKEGKVYKCDTASKTLMLVLDVTVNQAENTQPFLQFTVKRRSHSGWQLYQCRLPKVFICPTDFTVKNIDFLKGA